MPLVVGIDEAGYGPPLGPLVLGASVWRTEAPRPDGNWWPVLSKCVARAPSRGGWQLVVADSKQVFARSRGIGGLERSVLAFAQVASEAEITSLARLLAYLGAPLSPEVTRLPWYARLDLALPTATKEAASAELRQRLARTLDTAGLRCAALMADVLPEDALNRRLAQTPNKATVLLERVLRLIQRAASLALEEPLCVFVDRLGGRCHYRDALLTAFTGRDLRIVEETPACSAYALGGPPAAWDVSFRIDADQSHLPVALASMTAKYVREVLMRQFNAHWQSLQPTLTPTAGYHTDAQRFLAEITPLLPRTGLTADHFVRLR